MYLVFVFGIVYLSKLYFCLSERTVLLWTGGAYRGVGSVLRDNNATNQQEREREIDHLLDLWPRCSPALSPARSPARPPARSPARSPPLSPARSPARKSGARWPAGSAPGSVVTGDGPSAHISIV